MKINSIILIVVWAIAMLSICSIAIAYNEPYVQSVSTLEQKLTTNGWEVYITADCPWCIKQKEMFEHPEQIIIIVCDITPEKCLQQRIHAIPTWHNTKTEEVILGMQTIDQLVNMTK